MSDFTNTYEPYTIILFHIVALEINAIHSKDWEKTPFLLHRTDCSHCVHICKVHVFQLCSSGTLNAKAKQTKFIVSQVGSRGKNPSC